MMKWNYYKLLSKYNSLSHNNLQLTRQHNLMSIEEVQKIQT